MKQTKRQIKWFQTFFLVILLAMPVIALVQPAPYACFYGPPTNGSFVLTAGDSMTGDLNMTGNDIVDANFYGDFYGDGSGLTNISSYWTRTGTTISPNITGDTIHIGDGVQANKGIGFVSENTGWFLPIPALLRLEVNGFNVADYTSTIFKVLAPYLRIRDGTDALPSFAFTSDPDTGLYKEGSDAIGITTGGSKRLTINNTDAVFYVDVDLGSNNITANTYYGNGSQLTGISNYWNKTGTTLYTATAGDDVSLGGNLNISTGSNDGTFLMDVNNEGWLLKIVNAEEPYFDFSQELFIFKANGSTFIELDRVGDIINLGKDLAVGSNDIYMNTDQKIFLNNGDSVWLMYNSTNNNTEHNNNFRNDGNIILTNNQELQGENTGGTPLHLTRISNGNYAYFGNTVVNTEIDANSLIHFRKDVYVSDDDTYGFNTGNTKTLHYDTTDTRFEFNDDLFVNGNVTADYYFGDGSFLTGITVNGSDISLDDDECLFFDTANSKCLKWDSSATLLDFNDSFRAEDSIFVGQALRFENETGTIINTGAVWYNKDTDTFHFNGDIHPRLDDILIDANRFLYMDGETRTNWLTFASTPDEFQFNNDLNVSGNATANYFIGNGSLLTDVGATTFWQRIGTTLYPTTSGDNIYLDGGYLNVDDNYILLDSNQSLFLNGETFGVPIPSDEDAWTETTTDWSGGGISANTNDFVAGTASIQFTGVGAFIHKFNFTTPVNATGYTSFSTWGKRISKNSNVAWIRFYTNSTNYYQENISASIYNSEWKEITYDLTAFGSVGSPTWGDLTYMEISQTLTTPFSTVLLDKMHFGGGKGLKWNPTTSQFELDDSLSINGQLSIPSNNQLLLNDAETLGLKWNSDTSWFEFNNRLYVDGEMNVSEDLIVGDDLIVEDSIRGVLGYITNSINIGAYISGAEKVNVYNDTGSMVFYIDDEGNAVADGNMTATYFMGDGSLLTGLPGAYWNRSVGGGLYPATIGDYLALDDNSGITFDYPIDQTSMYYDGTTLAIEAQNTSDDIYLLADAGIGLDGGTLPVSIEGTALDLNSYEIWGSGSSNQHIFYNTTSGLWQIKPDLLVGGNVTANYYFGDGSFLTGVSAVSSLENLTDTNITSATEGDMLIYNSTQSKWVNAGSGIAYYFDAYDNTGGTSVTATWADIPLDTEREETGFNHTGSSADVIVDNNGTYVLTGRVSAFMTGTTRENIYIRFMRDTGGGYAEIDGSIGYGYTRNTATPYGTATSTLLMDLNSGDKVKIQIRSDDGTATLATVADASGLTIHNTVVGKETTITSEYWDRSGTTIFPKTAGDDIGLPVGDTIDFNYGGIQKSIEYNSSFGTVFMRDVENTSFIISNAGTDLASIHPRSFMIGGVMDQALATNINNCSAQGYTHIDCLTGTTGADLGIEDELEVRSNAYIGDAENFTKIAGDGSITLNGTARKKQTLEYYPYNIGGIGGTYNGVACVASGLASLNGMYFKSFDDGGAGQCEVANIQFNMPHNYVDGEDIEIFLMWTVGGTTGDVRWQAGITNVANGTTYSPSTYTWATPVNEPVAGTAWERQTLIFTLSGTGIVGGDVVSIIAFRDADNGGDDYSGDSYLNELGMSYLIDSMGEDQ